ANYGAFLQDLYRAIILDSKATILNKNLEFYGSIANTVLKGNQVHRLKLHAGDIVELEEGVVIVQTLTFIATNRMDVQSLSSIIGC
ncbi:19457_t:CDS:2, partial [Funneliformis geosporum]